MAAVTIAAAFHFASGDWLHIGLGLISALAYIVLGTLQIPREGRLGRAASIAWYPLMLIVMIFAMQSMLGFRGWGMEPLLILLNMGCISLIVALFTILTGRVRLSFYLTGLVLLLLVTADCAVIQFRGNDLLPSDFLSVGTALSVLPNYRFRINGGYFLGLLFWGMIPLAGACVPARKFARRGRVRAVAAAAAVVLSAYWYFGCSSLILSGFTRNAAGKNGFVAAFSAETLDMFEDKTPKGYSVERVAEIEADYRDAASGVKEAPDDAPAVIVIMNESFSNLDVLGTKLDTETEVLPYFYSLKENTIRGNALVSVVGGGTVHSEYSLLTGNALEDNDQMRSVYTMYIDHPIYSLATELRQRGYTTFATHPFKPGGYARNRVYPMIGFEEMAFRDDYPQQNLVRKFVSDQEMYEFLVQKYESRAEDEKLFMFGVTMQNHGGYDYEGENYTPSIAVRNGFRADIAPLEQYLGVIHESDKALEYLISYFEGVDSRVVILLYGDHQPGINAELLQEMYGGKNDTLEKQQLRYTVPFMIWANYDIEEREVELTSVPYLTNYLYEAAGLEPSAYNRFLSDLEQAIPAFNFQGYYSRSREAFIPLNQAEGEEAEWFNKYDILQYNSLFDEENRSELFFPLPE